MVPFLCILCRSYAFLFHYQMYSVDGILYWKCTGTYLSTIILGLQAAETDFY